MKAKDIALPLIMMMLLMTCGAAFAEATPESNFSFETTPVDETWAYPIAREILEDPGDVLRLVNKENLLDKTYPDEDTLVNATVRTTSSSTMKLRDICNDALTRLFDAAESEGVILYLHSAYRSFRTQEVMYYNRLQNNGGKDDGLVQKEGASDHQTGLGCDVISKEWIGSKFNAKFAETAEAQWMAANCARFGFIIRYPADKEDITGIAYEPWHLRYVGVEAAQYMTDNRLTLEEFTEEYQAALDGTWVSPQAAITEFPTEGNADVTVDTFSF